MRCLGVLACYSRHPTMLCLLRTWKTNRDNSEEYRGNCFGGIPTSGVGGDQMEGTTGLGALTLRPEEKTPIPYVV